jgi:cyanophycinase
VVAIGGHETRDERGVSVLRWFIDACGGRKARLLLLTTASPEPARKEAQYREVLATMGVKKLTSYHQNRRKDAASPEVLAAVDRADGVFFAGGSQLRLVTTVAGTPLAERLHQRHDRGMPIGGSSAGASALGAVMIARGGGGHATRSAEVHLSPGLGFFPTAIIDQHFRERNRYGRLIAAVLSHPALLGLGLDEGTGFAVDAAGHLTVLGRGVLTVFDGSDLQASDVGSVPADAPVAFVGLRVHALASGWRYVAEDRRVKPAARRR